MNWLLSLALLAISLGTQNPNWAIAASGFMLADILENSIKKYMNTKQSERSNNL